MTPVTLLLVVLLLFAGSSRAQDPPGGGPSLANLLYLSTSRGYVPEIHHVTTADYYNLTVLRHSVGRNGTSGAAPGRKRPVILMHGIFCSSAVYTIPEPEEALGFLLADRGYDVWLPNFRGNQISMTRTDGITPDDSLFWDWSFDTLTTADVTAVVEYVASVTQQNVSLIGHSEGATLGFTSLSSVPAVQSRVNFYAALAPVTYMKYQSSQLMNQVSKLKSTEAIYSWLGNKSISASGTFVIKKYFPFVCRLYPSACNGPTVPPWVCEKFPAVCYKLMCFTFGCGPTNLMDPSIYRNLFTNWPVTTAVRDLVHWAGDCKSGNFSHYDYGNATVNRQHYGTDIPPPYTLATIPPSTPVAVFIGQYDALADVKDSETLLAGMPNGTVVHHEVIPNYAHADFLYASTVGTAVYETIIDLLAKYSGGSNGHAAPTNSKEIARVTVH